MQDQLLTTEDIANYLQVDTVTVRRLVNKGELAAYKVGNEYRFDRLDLQNYLQSQRVSPGDEDENLRPSKQSLAEELASNPAVTQRLAEQVASMPKITQRLAEQMAQTPIFAKDIEKLRSLANIDMDKLTGLANIDMRKLTGLANIDIDKLSAISTGLSGIDMNKLTGLSNINMDHLEHLASIGKDQLSATLDPDNDDSDPEA